MNISAFAVTPSLSTSTAQAKLGMFSIQPIPLRWNLKSVSQTKAISIKRNPTQSKRHQTDAEDNLRDSNPAPNGFRASRYDKLNFLNNSISPKVQEQDYRNEDNSTAIPSFLDSPDTNDFSRSKDFAEENDNMGEMHVNSKVKSSLVDNLGTRRVRNGGTRPSRATEHRRLNGNSQNIDGLDANYAKPHAPLEAGQHSPWDTERNSEKDAVFRSMDYGQSKTARPETAFGRNKEVSGLDNSRNMSGNTLRDSTSKRDDEDLAFGLQNRELTAAYERRAEAVLLGDYVDSESGAQLFKGEQDSDGVIRSSKANKIGSNQDQSLETIETTSYKKFGAGSEQRPIADLLELNRELKVSEKITQESEGDDRSSIGRKSLGGGNHANQSRSPIEPNRESRVGERTAQNSEVDDRRLIGGKPFARGTLANRGSLKASSDQSVDSRSGRQVLKRSNLIAKQVISKASACSMGFVSQIWVDTDSWTVPVVEIRPTLLSGEMERFLLKDLCQVGDVILVEDENVLENELTMLGLDSLVGYDIITEDRYHLGKVRDHNFNINLGNVVSLEFDSFGVSFIPASVVSTYCLFTQDVVEVVSDTVIVHRGVEVRAQRLTKGLWDSPNWHAQSWNDTMVGKSSPSKKDYEELNTKDYELERQLDLLSEKYMHNKSAGKRSPNKISEAKDEWWMPMDY